MKSTTSIELDIALREDESGHDMVVCGLENGVQLHLTPLQARTLATRLTQLVTRSEIRSMLAGNGRPSPRTSVQPVGEASITHHVVDATLVCY